MPVNLAALTVGPRTWTADELRRVWLAKAANLERAWAHFDARDTVLTSLPFRASIELTQNCNFKCTMCAQSWDPKFARFDPEYNMKLDVFHRIAEQLFPTAISVDLRGFGETTVLPYWPDLVDSLDRYPYIEWNLVSNLSLTRDDVWEKMMRSNFCIGGSFDACTAETFESIRRGADFARIRHNLGVIHQARQSGANGYLYFISTIQRSNAHEMRGIVEMAHEFGVKEVQFHEVRGRRSVGLHGDLVLSRDGLERWTEEAVDAAIERGVTVTFNSPVFTRRVPPDKVAAAARPPSLPPRETLFFDAPAPPRDMRPYVDRLVDAYRVAVNRKCAKPFTYADFNHLGEMGTCNHMMHPEMKVMGDMRTQPLLEAWNGPLYQDFRRQLLTATPEDHRCQWCFANRLTD